MKYAIVLPDGAADEPVARLDDQTPLEAAATPSLDWIARNGRQGLVTTVPTGFSPGSDVATLSLLGYDPRVEHPGRAPLEAVARGVTAGADDLIFRCNFVTITDGLMQDFTAGHLSQAEADVLIADLNRTLADEACRFHAGLSYRNLMVVPDGGEQKLKTKPPHDIPDQPVKAHRPSGRGADRVRRIMDRAHAMLADHEINMVRKDLRENPATDIWLWGQGRSATLEPFATRFGLSAVMIAAVDIIRGIARATGMQLIDVPGATGYIDTDYAAKGRAAVDALDSFDLVIVHIEAPDEAGHLGDADAKVTAIERVDEFVVGPLLEKLKTFPQWRILVAPDHPTLVDSRVHSSSPPPFCFAGWATQTVLNRPFSEAAAAMGDLRVNPGHELMEYFLRQ